MSLTTEYLGIRLPHPLIAGASPMAENLDTVKQLEDSGAAAIVMNSLFEEELNAEATATTAAFEEFAESFHEAPSYLPSLGDQAFEGPEEYLDRLVRIRKALSIPVIGSLNGVSVGGWLHYAKLIEEAGADGIELNVYDVEVSPEISGEQIEHNLIHLVSTIRSLISIPVAIKLGPHYTALPNLVKRLEAAGADGVVLFNRLFQPDFDVEELDVYRLAMTEPAQLPPRLHWLAILSGQTSLSLGITGGVSSTVDVIKCLMAGAHGVQMVTALYRNGPSFLSRVRSALQEWMEIHEYESVDALRGCLSWQRCPEPSVYQRGNYVKTIKTWQPK